LILSRLIDSKENRLKNATQVIKKLTFWTLFSRSIAQRRQKTGDFATFHGKKAGRLVSVGPVNLPVTFAVRFRVDTLRRTAAFQTTTLTSI
jgi:hypothetical protein